MRALLCHWLLFCQPFHLTLPSPGLVYSKLLSPQNQNIAHIVRTVSLIRAWACVCLVLLSSLYLLAVMPFAWDGPCTCSQQRGEKERRKKKPKMHSIPIKGSRSKSPPWGYVTCVCARSPCALCSGFGRDGGSKVQTNTCGGSTSNGGIFITGPEPFHRDHRHPHFSIWGA